jgi:hypothetical protein
MVETLASSRDDDPARRAVVVLGASNVARGWTSLVEVIHRLGTGGEAIASRTDIFSAAGHGRSYGLRSRVLARELPSIVDCGLWPALDAYRGEVTAALVTDIGNDLLYDQPVEQVERWVATCIDRLAAHTDRVVLTLLPEVSPRTIGRARFLFFRTLFVPACRLSLAEIATRAAALNDVLGRLAATSGARLVEHDPAWYGLDPIHVVSRARHTAWERMLSPGLGVPAAAGDGLVGDGDGVARIEDRHPAAVRHRGRLRAARRWMFGREQHASQPCGRLVGGGAVSWF